MRLALVIPTMDQGGAEKQLCLLAENLPPDQFDVRVFLLTRDGPLSDRLRRAGVEVVVIGKRFKADPTALFRLRKHFQSFQPDIVHTWLFAANSFGRVAARMASVPRIMASERCVDLWKTAAHFLIDRRLAGFTETITVNSQGIADFYAGHGIPASKFRVIHNGITPSSDANSEESKPTDSAWARESLQIVDDRRLILAVGRLWPQKRYRDLIWAAELMATMRGDTTLVIVGDGPQSAELLRHRDAVSTPLHVRFAGHRSDVASLLPHADVFWIGSEYEGQSNSVIEAMQAGVPVVASDIPGNRDLVVPGETGFIVELGDTADFARQTHKLLEDPELARQMGESAKTRIANEFSVEKMVDAYVDLYRS
ncbi:glycosyltransferase family 4 protein [Rubripirellula obstinata]|uniref:glycosyltransferase family 4 protein n=1 Tax=Rubripirellula obstinata TaxID=406547 RepID=UPI0008358C17|nr:glycosyltransferase [Rubripirellula obstinata]